MNTPHPPPDRPDQAVKAKALAGWLSLLFVAAVLWPIRENWQRRPTDSFPLSHYPMFSENRRGKATVTYLVGVDRRGKQHFLSYRHAGTGGFNQVRKLIRKRSVKDPRGLCQQVAKAVARRQREPDARVDTIKIVRGRFAFKPFFAGNQAPVRAEELCTCLVDRTGSGPNPNHP
ncbi:MAG: hypothetical protein H7Z72_00165 [Bacteroidetes bacterium]|nr:hypothetical protein [Fibrella sp.]